MTWLANTRCCIETRLAYGKVQRLAERVAAEVVDVAPRCGHSIQGVDLATAALRAFASQCRRAGAVSDPPHETLLSRARRNSITRLGVDPGT